MSRIKAVIIMSVLAVSLAACGETRNERVLSGALIGTGVGAGTGALLGGGATGALVGGAIGAGAGAVGGAIVDDASTPRYANAAPYVDKSYRYYGGGRCLVTNRFGERYWTRCPSPY